MLLILKKLSALSMEKVPAYKKTMVAVLFNQVYYSLIRLCHELGLELGWEIIGLWTATEVELALVSCLVSEYE